MAEVNPGHLTRLHERIEVLRCDIHNHFWGAVNLYTAYRKRALVPYSRWQAARATWRDREYWD